MTPTRRLVAIADGDEHERDEDEAAAQEHGRKEAVLALADLVADDRDEPQERDARERREVEAADDRRRFAAGGEHVGDAGIAGGQQGLRPQQHQREREQDGEQDAGDTRRPRGTKLALGLAERPREPSGGRAGGPGTRSSTVGSAS